MTKTAGTTILGCLKFDITDFFSDEYKEIGTTDTPAIQIVEFERKLPEKEFDLFDSVRLIVMFDKYVITADTHINVLYRSKKRRISTEEIKSLTTYFHSKLGEDDAGRSEWTQDDENSLKSYTFARIWPMEEGDCFISLTYKEAVGLELSILFINNLLETIGKKINFLK